MEYDCSLTTLLPTKKRSHLRKKSNPANMSFSLGQIKRTYFQAVLILFCNRSVGGWSGACVMPNFRMQNIMQTALASRCSRITYSRIGTENQI